jgi:hypothetical protein
VAKVYVVQRTEHNFVPATDFGDIEFVALVNFPKFENPAKHIDFMKSKLEGFGPTDYLLIVGDPINIGVAMAILAKHGPFSVLKWDNVASKYVPVTIRGV